MFTDAISCIDQRLATVVCCPLQHKRDNSVQSFIFNIYHLRHNGKHMYHPLQYTKILHSAHKVYLCVLYDSHNKQRLFP
jgi:hypothetical protein